MKKEREKVPMTVININSKGERIDLTKGFVLPYTEHTNTYYQMMAQRVREAQLGAVK